VQYVVLCGPANTAPDRIIGPFDSEADAAACAAGQPGPPGRYAVVNPLEPPQTA
jgi:hypothetical protein